MINEVKKFLIYLKSNGDAFFIEVEGKPEPISRLISDYNSTHSEEISPATDGIIQLQENADKWGLEYRLYITQDPPEIIKNMFVKNNAYRPDYRFRMNKNEVIKELLNSGYKIGLN